MRSALKVSNLSDSKTGGSTKGVSGGATFLGTPDVDVIKILINIVVVILITFKPQVFKECKFVCLFVLYVGVSLGLSH